MAAKQDSPYDVFLSYSAQDKSIVRLLVGWLRQNGLNVWFDEWVLKPGDSIQANINPLISYGRTGEGLDELRRLACPAEAARRRPILCLSANGFGSDSAPLEAGMFRFWDPLKREHCFIPWRFDHAPIKGSLAQFH